MKITQEQSLAFATRFTRNYIRLYLPKLYDLYADTLEGDTKDKLHRHAQAMRDLPEDASVPDMRKVIRAAIDARAALAALDALDALAAFNAIDAYDARAALDVYATCLLDAADAINLDIPTQPNIDQSVIDIVDTEKTGFNMGHWHGDDNPKNWCNTTHCRAGGAIVSCGAVGIELEAAFGPAIAGGLIYAASYRAAGKPVTIPNFYASTKAAMADMRAQAAS